MMLKDFVLLASDTTRTKAYLSMMIRENKLPGMCIVYSDDIVGMQEKAIIQEKRVSGIISILMQTDQYCPIYKKQVFPIYLLRIRILIQNR